MGLRAGIETEITFIEMGHFFEYIVGKPARSLQALLMLPSRTGEAVACHSYNQGCRGDLP